jgi:uncharacterized membrane protein YtjA (UPF0391 family)
MYRTSILLLLLAELSGLLGFSGLVGDSYTTLARILFWVFLLFFSAALVMDGKHHSVIRNNTR